MLHTTPDAGSTVTQPEDEWFKKKKKSQPPQHSYSTVTGLLNLYSQESQWIDGLSQENKYFSGLCRI